MDVGWVAILISWLGMASLTLWHLSTYLREVSEQNMHRSWRKHCTSSQLGMILPPRRHLPISADISDGHN